VLKFPVVFSLAAACCAAQTVPLLDILAAELDRNFAVLKAAGDPSAYFISYNVVEQRTETFSATLGALQSRNRGHGRVLDVSVRVGDRTLDNYHSVRGERSQVANATLLPVEDKADEIRRRVWLETDRTFRRAAQRLINLRTSTQANLAVADKSDDFSAEEPATFSAPPKRLDIASEEWANRVRRWSAEFKKYPDILSSAVGVRLSTETKYLVNTEGTRLQHGRTFARITVSAQGKAADGMDLFTTESFDAADPAGLPADAAVVAGVHRVAKELTRLLDAPLVEPSVGPAILSGRAAAVFFHEIFGHRIEGHRQKDESDGQTFTKSLGQQILPEFLSVVFDPTKARLGNTDLNGTYGFDDEGVKARPVVTVESGTLKTFLMSRTPVPGFPKSNGHGRKQPGADVVSRQSNLIVESSKQVPEAKLREMLVEEIKRQNKPYGYYFETVTGGFTTTGRAGLQAFKVIPLIVYRVYPDGRPDEMVRGVDIVGTPLASFSKIVATSDKQEVFNGYCGAESGSVPVAAAAPALLVSELEIQKKEKGRDRPPLLPAPPMGGAE
jgi:predicted Zn-dependent protease